jgi:hypothetical protein
MIEEIASGLKAGDGDTYLWLVEQLQECGGSEMSMQLALGVIAQLLPEGARDDLNVACEHTRRWAH